ncbi:protein-L-isoaspartate O-methyltransferase [Candidatus Woesearchaeota archaeon]|nr:protein-L-isoaspartate O-methyltransferase [Candidatus Woesearchaeota archaeon]
MDKQGLLAHLLAEGFDESLIAAFAKVDRSQFVRSEYLKMAYEDMALPVSEYTTISQPYTIAFMLRLLEIKEGSRILEIGAGTGYVMALMAQLAPKGELIGLEIDEGLARGASERLQKYPKIKILHGDGKLGLPKLAPFDRILISAACNTVPIHLKHQLTANGILVAPVGHSIFQYREEKLREFPGFSFIPLR